MISTRTHAITQVNLKDNYEAQKLQNRSFVQKSTVSGGVQTLLIDRGFLDLLSGEQYLIEMEPLAASPKNSALLVKMENPEQAWKILKEYRDTTEFNPSEYYLQKEILFFPEENFPAHLFNGRFLGFKQTFVCQVGQILLMSNSANGIRSLLDDYSQGNTWAKMESDTKPRLSPAAGYSKTFLLQKIWPSWVQTTNPSWSTFIQKYETELKAFTSVGLRIHQNSKGKQATLTLGYTNESVPLIDVNKTFELASGKEVALPENLIFGPKSNQKFQ